VSALRLLTEHVERFNDGVRSGDFGPMLAHFADDAEMVFDGVPAGPFVGLGPIAAAYRDQPPADEVRILDVREEGDMAAASYAWSTNPTVRAGELRLTRRGEQIAKLVVTFE
jgi:steroid Delta-isomerase